MFTIYLGGVLGGPEPLLRDRHELGRDVCFHEELAKVLKKFKGTFIFCLGSTLIIILGYWVVPYQWQIQDFASIFPFAMLVVCHFLLPVVLNPSLIMLSW